MRLLLLFFPLLLLAQPQQGDGIWLRNAFYGEAQTFDACVGHQPGNGQYHHHASPTCLRAQLGDNVELVRSTRTGPVYRENPTKASPILGWAFDGHPIYGPYATINGAVRRVRSSFRLRTIMARQSLPEWVQPLHVGVSPQLAANQYGPPINAQFPLGRYLEDYEFVAGLGDLDIYNGRFAPTAEYPQGIYAYHVTLEEDGAPAFPYIFAAQFYGTVSGGTDRNVPATAMDTTASDDPLLATWQTKNNSQTALHVVGTDPSAAPAPLANPANADVQRLRATDANVYLNSNNLASYVMGPWFDALQPGGIFRGLPTNQNLSIRLPRTPTAASTRTTVGLGAQGLWVNGVAVFNFLDGSSYSNARATDVGGGLVSPSAYHVSAASFERGPLAAGSYATAFPLFGGDVNGTVTIVDSAGVSHTAETSYVSDTQTNYRIPPSAALGNATVSIGNGRANVNIVATYPNLFAGVPVGGGFVSVYGTGLGSATSATATVNAQPASVSYAGPQGEFAGLDQFNIQIPAGVTGVAEIVITAAGKRSNAITVSLQ